MKIVEDWGHVDFEIERDAGNEILILMGKDECALPSWRKLKRLCNKAIKILEKRMEDKISS